jgi:hypothetical protein
VSEGGREGGSAALHAMYCMPCTACRVLHAMHCMPCTACRVLHAVYCMPCTACHVLHAMHYIAETVRVCNCRAHGTAGGLVFDTGPQTGPVQLAIHHLPLRQRLHIRQ